MFKIQPSELLGLVRSRIDRVMDKVFSGTSNENLGVSTCKNDFLLMLLFTKLGRIKYLFCAALAFEE